MIEPPLPYKGQVPREPTDCRYCVDQPTPCDNHRGLDGKPVPYEGPEVYIPSDFVLDTVGKDYIGTYGWVYRCTGYDRRCGFWMVSEATAEHEFRRTNVTEAAIGRTFHEVRKRPGR